MAEPVIEQRLVAILAADVAGYTRLMADDDAATLAALDPVSGDAVLHQMGLCHFILGDYAAAESVLRKRILQNPSTDSSRVVLAATYGCQGRGEEARAVWRELLTINPNYSFAERRKALPYRNPDDLERIANGLRGAGIEG